MVWFFLSAAFVFNLFLIYLHFNFNSILSISVIVVINTIYIITFLMYKKLNQKNRNLSEELENTRSELTKTLKEIFQYTQILEDNNKRIEELEEGNLSDQEQINEILSELSLYTNQLESIVNTIDAGICTINKQYIIQSDFNRSFRKIFGVREYWESSILNTIFYNLEENKKKELKEFIDVTFSNSSTSDSMINAANPVPEFLYVYNEGGKIEEKHISVKVSRILNEKKNVEKLMFVFNDITLQKIMEENIKAKEKKYQDELELLTNIFQYDKGIIISFINDMNERIEIIQNLVDSLQIDKTNENELKEIQRVIHSIKGEAFSLGFKQLAESCASMENYIKENYTNTITTEQNLIILDFYTKLKQKADEINEIAKKIFSYSNDAKVETNTLSVHRETFNTFKLEFNALIELFEKGELTKKSLEDFYRKIIRLDWISLEKMKEELELITEKTATNYDRKVNINFIYDIDGLPLSTYKLLKEIFLHLIRNSISHGIENREERIEKGKAEAGKINIHIYEEDNNYVVRYSDDGRGLNTTEILKQAIKTGIISEEEASQMDEKAIMNLIFKDGFSAKEKGDMVSGTGVGMSIVKNNILYLLHGKLTMKNNPSQGVTFIIKFPKE